MPHGMMTTHPDIINRDILAFIEGSPALEESVIAASEPAVA
jgi:hypothetical protein